MRNSLRDKYSKIDTLFIDQVSRGTGSYYIRNFKNIKLKFLINLNERRSNYGISSRIISGYPYTKDRLFKMGLVNTPSRKCGELIQNMNHIFWVCSS